jgi:hypothetical protein
LALFEAAREILTDPESLRAAGLGSGAMAGRPSHATRMPLKGRHFCD